MKYLGKVYKLNYFRGYRICEFSSDGNIYGIRKYLVKEDIMAYESVIIDSKTFKILEKSELPQGKHIKVLSVTPNKLTNSAILSLSNKQIIV